METKLKIPQHILEEINLGEIPAQKYYEKYGRENLEEELEKIRISDMEFYNELPTVKIPVKRNWTAVKGFAIAACLCSLFLGIINYYQPKNAVSSDSSERIKGDGEKKLFVYRQNGQNVELLKNKSYVKAGDILQLAFKENNFSYIVIFSVDGNGNITNHYPDSSFEAVNLHNKAGITFLDYSYELDDAPDYELFVMATSDYPFTVDSKKIEGLSLKQLQNGKYLPENTKFTTFLVTK